jgi:hypothetical protein
MVFWFLCSNVLVRLHSTAVLLVALLSNNRVTFRGTQRCSEGKHLLGGFVLCRNREAIVTSKVLCFRVVIQIRDYTPQSVLKEPRRFCNIVRTRPRVLLEVLPRDTPSTRTSRLVTWGIQEPLPLCEWCKSHLEQLGLLEQVPEK